jgi:type IV conjugative transfer system coupling protein TraD
LKIFQTLAEGGQTWAHRVRMVRQVIKIAYTFSFLIALIYFGYNTFRLDHSLYENAYYCIKAEIGKAFSSKEISVSASFWEKLKHERVQASKKISPELLKKLTRPKALYLYIVIKRCVISSLKLWLIVFLCILTFFIVRGSAFKKKEHIAGRKRCHAFFVQWLLIFKRQTSDLKVASLPLVKGSETQHILVTGGTGTGKTNCFHHLLPQIRHKKQKAVIIDTTGSFIEKYFDPKKDIMLNPFSDQGAPWHPWVECEDLFDFDSMAESMIPQSYNDHENYWRTAARTLFTAVLQKFQDTKRTSELSQWLLYEPLDRLAELIQHTKAAAHIDPNSEKTAASIRSVAASFLGCLEHLKDTSHPYSIKKWVKDTQSDGWLFLYAKPSQRATLNPLIACWFSVAVRSLIQLSPDLKRRLWFVIDELPTLQKLKEIDTLVAESRKYGGCALLALQSPSQLEEIYGKSTTQAIFGNCATRIIFAEHDAETSEKIAKSLGENEIKEYQEGISYGAHEVRDGVTLSHQTKKKLLVDPTDIQSLKNNHAYVRLPGNLPICKIRFIYNNYIQKV